MMNATKWMKLGGATVWGLAIWGALLLSDLPGHWGHGICGPWGCGPPLQALVACHLAWLVLLLPGAWLLRGQPRKCSVAISIMSTAVISLILITIHEAFVWLPVASSWQRSYFPQRIGFVVATLIEVPVTEMLLSGAFLLVLRPPGSCPKAAGADESQVAREGGRLSS